MYAASLLFSRLFVILALAVPAYTLLAASARCPHHAAVLDGLDIGGADLAEWDIDEGFVEDAAFGVDHWIEGEGYVFSETDHIHLVPGTSFGWRLKLKSPVDSVLLREEFVLPSAPAYWGLGPDTRLSPDRRTAVTERRVSSIDGFLQSQWTVTPGDPAGNYEMRVFLDGELIRAFEFEAHDEH